MCRIEEKPKDIFGIREGKGADANGQHEESGMESSATEMDVDLTLALCCTLSLALVIPSFRIADELLLSKNGIKRWIYRPKSILKPAEVYTT